MASEEWEAKCKLCGKCCYSLVVEEDGSIHRDNEIHCSGFDPATKSCMDYKDRFRLHPNCIELFPRMISSLKSGFLPPDCGYMESVNADTKII